MGTLAVEVVNLLQNFHMRFSDTQLRLRTDGTQVSSKYIREGVPYGYESYKKLRIRTTRGYGAGTSELVPDNTPATHQKQTSSACGQWVVSNMGEGFINATLTRRILPTKKRCLSR